MNVEIIDIANFATKDDKIYFYIISQLFNATPLDEILPYWEATEKDVIKAMAIMESVLRVHMIRNSLVTNHNMAKIYRGEKDKIHPSEFFTAIQDLAQAYISPMWSEYFRSLYNVKAFFEGEIDTLASTKSDPKIEERTREMRNFYKHINLNVKYFVTFPNVLMFAYFAKVFKYSEDIYLWWIDAFLTIDADIILQEYLKGKLPPLFLFTNYEDDNVGIDSVEVMYSVYFAIQQNLFELYGVDPLDWLKRFVDSYLLPKKEVLRKWSKELRKHHEGKSSYEKFIDVCEKVSQFRAGETLREKSLTTTSPRGIFEHTFHGRMGQITKEKSDLEKVLGINDHYDGALAEALEVIRSDIDPRLNSILLLRGIFKKVFVQAVSREGTVVTQSQVIAKIDDEIKAITDLRDEIFDLSVDIEEKLSNCLLSLDREEHLRQSEVLRMEHDYLEQIYIALAALNELPHDGKTVAELSSQFSDDRLFQSEFYADMPKDVDLLTSVREVLMRKSHMNIAFAMINGYEENTPTPLIAKDNTGRYFYRLRGHDTALRFIHYVKYGFNGAKVSLQSDQIEIKYPTTYKELFTEFINWRTGKKNWIRKVDFLPSKELSYEENLRGFRTSALIYILNEDGSSLGAYAWSDYYGYFYSGTTRAARRIMQSKVAVYKMRYQMELDPIKRVNCDSECLEQKHLTMKEESKSLLDYSKRLIENTNINGITDFDEVVLEHYDSDSFYSAFHSGPTYMFTEYNGMGHHVFTALADDIYTFMTAYHLGKYSTYRGIRPGAEAEANGKPPASSMGPGEDEINEIFHSRINYWREAEKYYQTLERQDRELLIPIDPDVLAYINSSVTWRIKTEMRMIDAFENAIKEYAVESMDDAQPFYFSQSIGHRGHDIILREKVRSGYHTILRGFNDKTHSIFLPEEFKGNFKWETTADDR